MPKRSAPMPISGTVRLPMPHANPIINDETVAAPPLTKLCANVTLIGSVDCSSRPPIASIAVKPSGGRCGASAMNGTAAISVHRITRRAPTRSASGPPRNPPMPLANRYSDTAVLASPIVQPCCVSSVGVNVMKP